MRPVLPWEHLWPAIVCAYVAFAVRRSTFLQLPNRLRASGDRNDREDLARPRSTGWNHWEVLEEASVPGPPVGGAFRGGGALRRPGREMITEVMDVAVANGLKVVRAWAHTVRRKLLAPRH